MMKGKEALIALANGQNVEYRAKNCTWVLVNDNWKIREFDQSHYEFRLKPRTISINGIEVPAPFEPKEGDNYWYMTSYGKIDTDVWCSDLRDNGRYSLFGVYRTESDIEQVVAALRSIFK